MSYIQQYQIYIVTVTAMIAVLACLIALITLLGNAALKRRFKKWKAIHATADLEEVYAKTLDEVAQLREELEDAKRTVEYLRGQVRSKISTAKIKRYNAFSDTGSDLSFSVALLDDEKNGVVISSIYGRDESRTYAKPIEQGQSNYTLTDEELTVVHGHVEQKPSRRPVHA